MFKKLFGKKEAKSPESQVEASKGYHSCVTTCEKDMENLETECENLRKDNADMRVKFGNLCAENTLSCKDKVYYMEKSDKLSDELSEKVAELAEKNELIEELQKRLKESDEQEGTPVKYASARKVLTKSKLKQLRASLESIPNGASGFGGSCSVYDKKTKRLSLVEFKSKADALAIVERAEKGNVDIIM